MKSILDSAHRQKRAAQPLVASHGNIEEQTTRKKEKAKKKRMVRAKKFDSCKGDLIIDFWGPNISRISRIGSPATTHCHHTSHDGRQRLITT